MNSVSLYWTVATTVLLLYETSDAANILGVFPIGGTSHWLPYEAVLKALAAAGHNITVITSYRQKQSVQNWVDIDVSGTAGVAVNSLSMDFVKSTLSKTSSNFDFIRTLSHRYCEIAHSHPKIKQLLSDPHIKFDVVLTEIFGADCDVGFAWKFKIPLISITSSRPPPWAYARMGNPVMPAYMHTIHVNYPQQMNFFQRIQNTFFHLYYVIMYNTYHNGRGTDEISRKFFGPDTPPVNEIVQNTSLLFVNSHYTMDGAIPLVPNIVQIGGIHIDNRNPDKLPDDIEKFMNEAKEGVIYFTFGSLVRVSSLSNDTIEAFRDTFAQLPQRVLWKFELDFDRMPPNVLTRKWFPQKAIFNHPKLKLFITHGGWLGLNEAVFYGIPIVGIPLFFDQYRNIQNMIDRRVAVSLDYNNLTKVEISRAINTILQDEGYSKRMKTLSNIYQDRPISAAESVVYWTEYVIRHNGAGHLRTAAADMPWYKYLLIDVIGFLLIILLIILYLLYRLLSVLTTGIMFLFNGSKPKLKTK